LDIPYKPVDSDLKRLSICRSSVRAGFLLLFSCLNPSLSFAQETDESSIIWRFESEVGAAIFFGASDQTTVAMKVGIDGENGRFKLENDLSYLYGEASGESGSTFVNKRSWSVGTNLDYKGFSRMNPYLFGSALSSLEKAIRIRYKGGVGAKLTALESETTVLDLAVAVLGEKTEERSSDNGGSEVLARWAGVLNLRRTFSEDRTVFEFKTEYSPGFKELADFTVRAETSLAFKLSEILMLKLSVVDNYDTGAMDRGAVSNNDGRVLFSVLSSF
jgi:hypothetical protein